MAKLIKCKDCGNKISKSAKSCPNCGEPQKKGLSGCGAVVLLLVLGFILLGVIGSNMGGGAKETSTPKTAEELRKDELSRFFSAWDGSHKNLVKYVKADMHDPKSFEHVETKYVDKGDKLVLQMEFRGKNQYNAVVTHAIYAEADMQGNILKTEMQK